MNSPGNHLGAQPDSEYKQLSLSKLFKSPILRIGFCLVADQNIHKVKVSAPDKNNLVMNKFFYF